MVVIPESPTSWPRYHTGPEAHMHALGVISVNYNLYENNLFGVFAYPIVFRSRLMRFDACARLYGDLNTETRFKVMRSIFETEDDQDLRESVDHLIHHFGVCAEKRHLLLHSRIETPLGVLGDLFDDKETLSLVKGTKEDWSKLSSMQLSLPNLRAVADEMHDGNAYCYVLYCFLMGRDGSEPHRVLSPTLPERPRIPRKLTIRPRDEA